MCRIIRGQNNPNIAKTFLFHFCLGAEYISYTCTKIYPIIQWAVLLSRRQFLHLLPHLPVQGRDVVDVGGETPGRPRTAAGAWSTRTRPRKRLHHKSASSEE